MSNNNAGGSLFDQIDELTGKFLLKNEPRTRLFNLEIEGIREDLKPIIVKPSDRYRLDVTQAENGKFINNGRHTKAPSGNGYAIDSKYLQRKGPPIIIAVPNNPPPIRENIKLPTNYQLDMMNNTYTDGTPRYVAGQGDQNMMDARSKQGIQNIRRFADEIMRLKQSGFADNSPEIIQRVAAIEDIKRDMNPNYGVEVLAQRAEEKRAAEEAKRHAENIAALNDLKAAVDGMGGPVLMAPPSPFSSAGFGGISLGTTPPASGASTPKSGSVTPKGPTPPASGSVTPKGPTPPASGSVTPKGPTPPASGSVTPKGPTPPASGSVTPKATSTPKAPANNEEVFKKMFETFGNIKDSQYDEKNELGKADALNVLNDLYSALVLMDASTFTQEQKDLFDNIIVRIEQNGESVNNDSSVLLKSEVEKIQNEIFDLQSKLLKKTSSNPFIPNKLKNFLDKKGFDTSDYSTILEEISKYDMSGNKSKKDAPFDARDRWKAIISLEVFLKDGVELEEAKLNDIINKSRGTDKKIRLATVNEKLKQMGYSAQLTNTIKKGNAPF